MADSQVSQSNGLNELNEETPLLTDPGTSLPVPHEAPTAAVDAEDGQPGTVDDDSPIPVAQLLLLCYARTVEPMVFFSIFPFVNQMVQENGNLSEADIGFYSGLIESLFSLTQTVVMIFWGRLSDQIGRKPVLTISLFGVAITATLFGFSRSIWQMVLSRCLAGVFAGSIVTVRTMTAELCTKRTQARVFSYFAFGGNIAIFLGPLIGGALADPARQYGGVFARISFFKTYPFALATSVIGGIVCSSAILVLLFVKETKKPVTPSDTESESRPTSTWGLLRYPGVATVLYIYGYSMLLGIVFTSVIPVFWYTSPALGGTGFSPFMISIYMAMTGIAQAIWLLVIFPPLHKRYGTGGILKACGTAYPFVYLQLPFVNALLRLHTHRATLMFWILSPIFWVTSVGVSMVFTAVQLAINDISPSPETFGTLNSLALTLSSAIRAVSPWAFSSLFALGARTQILGGYLIWVILIIIGTGYAFSVRLLPAKAAGNGRKP